MSDVGPDSREGRGRSQWKQWLAILAIFIGGICVGFAISIHVIHRGIQRVVFEQEVPDTGHVVAGLDSFLDLDAKQQASIGRILDEEFTVLASKRGEVRDEMLAQHMRIIELISDELTTQQREKLHSHLSRFEHIVDPHGMHFEHMHDMHDRHGH